MDYNRYLDPMKPSASIKGGLDGSGKYNLAVGSPDILPPAEIIEIINSFVLHPDFRYQPSKGSKTALENIHQIILESGSDINPEKNIILCSGAKLGIYLTLKTITNANDPVMLLQPYWLSYPDICQSLGLRTASFKLNFENSEYNQDELRKDLVENQIKVIIINNPNNPAGIVMGKQFIQDLVSFCSENNIWVILDEVYKDLTFKDFENRHSGLMHFSNLIRIGSLSKSLAMPGLRLGYVAGNETFIRKYNLFNQHICTSVNSFSHFITERITKSTFQNFTKYCTDIYSERYQISANILRKKGFDVFTSESSFYLMVKKPNEHQNVSTWMQDLSKKGIVVTEGRFYGSQFIEYIRICLTLPKQQLVSVLKLF